METGWRRKEELILERVEGYMKRAEEMSEYLKKQGKLDKQGGGGGSALGFQGKGTEKRSKMQKRKNRFLLETEY